MTPDGNEAFCPRCGSTSLQAVTTNERSLARAVGATFMLGVAAGVTAGNKSVVQVICLNCGAVKSTTGAQAQQSPTDGYVSAAKKEQDKRLMATFCLALLVICLLLFAFLRACGWLIEHADSLSDLGKVFVIAAVVLGLFAARWWMRVQRDKRVERDASRHRGPVYVRELTLEERQVLLSAGEGDSERSREVTRELRAAGYLP